MISWSIYPTIFSAKFSHVFFQFTAGASVTVGLIAIIKYKGTDEASLTTIHSWMGVCAAGLFLINFIYGLISQIIKSCNSQFFTDEVLIFKNQIHRVLGCCSFGFTTIAICTGIMNQLDQTTGVCDLMPYGCKIGNSLGIFVGVTAITTVLIVFLRRNRILTESTNDYYNQLNLVRYDANLIESLISLNPAYPNRAFIKTVAIITTFLLVISVLVLLILWLKEPTKEDTGFLGKPDWITNLFPWHVVLMVGGFFIAQVCL